MLGSADHADIAVGYFFMSGFEAVADELSRLNRTRILVGRTDRPTLEAVAAGLQQARPLEAHLNVARTIPRRQRQAAAADAATSISGGIASMAQTDENQAAVERLQGLVTSGLLEVRAYPREFLHAKAYLCWYDNHAEPGAAIVGSSNFTLAGFTGNTELNVRVTGDDDMAVLKDWFEDLWTDSVDISALVEQSLTESWAVKQYTP
jgi:phosphatidylserine/phosphatidylglycerophosphate/cardiolipin synthase-like enzyme